MLSLRDVVWGVVVLALAVTVLVLWLRDRPPHAASHLSSGPPPASYPPAPAGPASGPSPVPQATPVVIVASGLGGVASPGEYRSAVAGAIRSELGRYLGPRWVVVVTITELPVIRSGPGGTSIWLWPRAGVLVELISDAGAVLPIGVEATRLGVWNFLAERVEDAPRNLALEVVVIQDAARLIEARRSQIEEPRSVQPATPIILPIPIMPPMGGGGGHRGGGGGGGGGGGCP